MTRETTFRRDISAISANSQFSSDKWDNTRDLRLVAVLGDKKASVIIIAILSASVAEQRHGR